MDLILKDFDILDPHMDTALPTGLPVVPRDKDNTETNQDRKVVIELQMLKGYFVDIVQT